MAQPDTSTRTLSVPQTYALARTRYEAGALDQAQEICRQVLGTMPDHAGTVVMLASIAFRQGDERSGQTYMDRAIDLSRATIQREPADLGTRAVLVNLLLARDRTAEAEALMPDLDIPLNPIRATGEEFAARREASIGRSLPLMVICTVPKSASESIWNKLAEGLGLAQCYL